MNVGNIGRPRTVSGPSSAVITESLNLLLTFGGGDQKVRELLTELQAATAHNEKLLAQLPEIEAREADVTLRESRVREAEARVDAKLVRLERIRAGVDEYFAHE